MSTGNLARQIRECTTWDEVLLRELCYRADMLDDWEAADGEGFEHVAEMAAEKLGVEIY